MVLTLLRFTSDKSYLSNWSWNNIKVDSIPHGATLIHSKWVARLDRRQGLEKHHYDPFYWTKKWKDHFSLHLTTTFFRRWQLSWTFFWQTELGVNQGSFHATRRPNLVLFAARVIEYFYSLISLNFLQNFLQNMC